MALELGNHQLKAIGKLKNGSILKGGVGTGKSITALVYFYTRVCGGTLRVNQKSKTSPPNNPKDLYIITTAKKRDKLEWNEELAKLGLSPGLNSSFGGINVTIDSWNNVANYEGVKDAYFIFDEQRLVGSGAWVKAFLSIVRSNLWLVLTATPGDTWMDYIPVLVAHGFYKNRTEFIRRHVVYNNFSRYPKIDHYVETGILESYRRHIIVEMPYVRHTKRHVQSVFVSHDEETLRKVVKERWNVYTEEPVKNVVELFVTMRRVVNSDVSRLGEVMRVLEKHPRLIIFYNFNYELEFLRTLAKTLNYPVGEWNGQKHQEIPETEKWMYLVQYTAGSEGWNCVSTDAMLFYSLTYSYKAFEQSKGRIDRMNTPYTDLYYYVLRSKAQIDQAIHKALLAKKNFSEADFSRSLPAL